MLHGYSKVYRYVSSEVSNDNMYVCRVDVRSGCSMYIVYMTSYGLMLTRRVSLGV